MRTPVFDLKEFQKLHTPTIIGYAPCDIFEFPHYAIRILDMPIMMHGDVKIPDFADKFEPFIHTCLTDVQHIDTDYFAYLTVDQGLVKSGTPQRTDGAHVDGFQGIRIKDALPHDFSYCVSNTLPTIFYNQTWDIDALDKGKHNFFLEFDRQARQDCAYTAPPYAITKFDAYCVHKGQLAPYDTLRTFIRLSFTVREFDRKGNSINPLFDYNWPYISRCVDKTLI